MKKVLIFVTVFLVGLGLFACGDTKNSTNTSTTDNQTTNSSTTDNQTTNSSTTDNQTTIDPTASLKLNPKYGSYYQIFIRSFADSDGNGIGDIKGITENIDYISDLGFEGIWLMPFTEADSYHGYDVTDYYTVDPDYGTNDDLKELLDVCHEKGIKVIMDFVINHTSKNHEWFQKALAGETKYYNYYVWSTAGDERVKTYKDYWAQSPNGKYYYCYFSSSMPDLNYANKAVRDEVVNIGKFWADLGIDGFRVDGALHICGQGEYADGSTVKSSINYLKLIRQYLEDYYVYDLKREKPYIVTEVYDESGNQSTNFFSAVDSTFDFWCAKKLMDAVNSTGAVTYASSINDKLNSYRNNEGEDLEMINAPFIRNHDMDRPASLLDSKEKLRMVAEMLLSLEGNPFVYYGEELGMKGIKSDGTGDVWDETRRLPFLWGAGNKYQTTWFDNSMNKGVATFAEQKDNPNSLYNTYKTLLNLRKSNIALKYGTFANLTVSDNRSMAAFTRTFVQGNYSNQVLVIHNFDNATSKLPQSLLDLISSRDGKVLYYSYGSYSNVMEAKTTLIIDLGRVD